MKTVLSKYLVVLSVVLLVAVSLLAGCKGSTGSPGLTAGTLTGIVSSATGSAALAGVAVTTAPDGGKTTTDSSGAYTLLLPAGTYTVTFSLANYTQGSATANVVVGLTTPLNVTMGEAKTGAPTVTIAASGQDVGYGSSFTVTANATDPNGDKVTYSWTGATGTDTTATGATVSLATALAGSAAPASDPGGYITAYTQESRLGVLPINSDTRGAKTVTVKADDGRGQSTSASVTVYATGLQPGIKTVAVGVPVYLNSGSNSTTNTWTVTPPAGSAVAATLPAGRNPFFVPDVVGKYTVATSVSATPIDIYAGKWIGVISGGSYVTKVVSGKTYTNYPQVSTDAACAVCHNDVAAADEFTPWKATGHANFFATGIEGITSNSGTCTPCHLVGYDTSAAAKNDGFDDMAAAEGFAYKKGVGAWLNMLTNYPQTARRANIQCEDCHGPQDTGASGAHGTTVFTKDTSSTTYRIGFGAEVCAQCHASGTGHHIYSEWQKSGHANMQLAIDEGTSASCGRCHSAQGYTVYLSRMTGSGIFGSLTGLVNWDLSTVQPQTCVACHDPHDDSNPNQLRVYDATPLLPAGFSVTGYGKGALCVTCHNTRNGAKQGSSTATYLHEDRQPTSDGLLDYAPGTPSYSAPHTASQGDVIAGHNAYFMGYGALPMPSRHTVVGDVCVGCHMALNPVTHLSHGSVAPNAHVMTINSADKATVCANCHSSSVTGDALVAGVEAQLANINAQMGKNLISKLTNTVVTVIAYDPVTDLYSGATGTTAQVPITLDLTTGTNSISSASLVEAHGQIGFTVTLVSAVSITWNDAAHTNTLVNSFEFQLGTLKNQAGTATIFLPTGSSSSCMARAAWNYFLAEGDGSFGIHNPSFVQGMLNNTYATIRNTGTCTQ